MPTILDGNRVRDQILRDLRPRVAALASAARPPGLAVVLVGHDPGSQIYVRNKVKACAELGIASESVTPSATITTEELLAVIDGLPHREQAHPPARHHGAMAAVPDSRGGQARGIGGAQRHRGQADGVAVAARA